MASSVYTDPTIDNILALSESGNNEALEVEPLHAGKKLVSKAGDYENLREWVTTTHSALIDPTRAWATTQLKNLALWIGLHYKSQGPYAQFVAEDEDVSIDSHKVIINNIYDVERNRYSKITRNNPQTRVVPLSPEYEDFSGAKVGNMVLKNIKSRTKQKRVCNEMLRQSFIFGEAWVNVEWDKDKGPVSQEWEEELKEQKRKKKEKEGDEDNSLVLDSTKPIFIGDHKLRLVLPWNLFLDPKIYPDDVQWIISVDYVHEDELKFLYPEKEKKISATEGAKSFNVNTLQVENLKNHCVVYTIHARSSKFLRDGCRFVCTPECMLEAPTQNPNSFVEESQWGNLPYERLTDIDVPGRLRGYSTIQILANLQHSENQMHTMIKHYLLLLGHPKIGIPREGNIKIDELGDDSFYFEFDGGFKPEVLVPNPIPQQVVAFAEMLRDRMQKLGDLHGVSSGDLPNNVRAAKAIRLLQELEDLRSTSVYEKWNQLFVDLDRKLLAQTSNYDSTDGRLLTILGKGNEYLVEDFDAEIFSKKYGVEMEVTGSIPPPGSARVEFMLQAQNLSGNTLFTPEKMAKMMGLESEEEFIDAATVSVIKAGRENDWIITGKEVPSPEPWENHIVEIREHAVMLQSASFPAYPQKVREAALDHVRAHEMLLWMQTLDNPALAQYMLTTQPWFPLVFKLPKDQMPLFGPPPGMPPQQGSQQQQPKQEAPEQQAA